VNYLAKIRNTDELIEGDHETEAKTEVKEGEKKTEAVH
jgi:hypothetical protein